MAQVSEHVCVSRGSVCMYVCGCVYLVLVVSRLGVFGACHVVSVDMDVSAMHMFHNVYT